MSFTTRVLMLCPVEHRAAACIDAAYLSGNPGDAVPEFFSIPCMREGASETTHYGAVTAAREEVAAMLPALASSYPGCAWALLERDMGTPAHAIYYPRWQDALEFLGFYRPAPVEDEVEALLRGLRGRTP